MVEKNILEIGPGKWAPLHNRDVGSFKLDSNERYFAVDIDREQFNSSVWEEIRKQYGDRVCLVQADANHLPFPDESQDEVVALGIFSKDPKEVDRVLKRGGILRIHINDPECLVDVDLLKMGYRRLDQESKIYDYKNVAVKKIKRLAAEGKITQEKAEKMARDYTEMPITVATYQKL